jgi:DNA-binding NarL/FixJ family response regulator
VPYIEQMGVKTGAGEAGRGSGSGVPTVAIISRSVGVRGRIAALLTAEGFAAVPWDEPAPGPAGRSPGPDPAVAVLCLDGAVTADAVQGIQRELPDTRIVLVFRPRAGRSLPSRVRGRVDAVVFMDQVQEALAPTISAVLAEQVVFPRSERRRFEHLDLSHRERQVVALAASGHTNDEIASRLFLSTSTVKSHLTSAFSKLGVSSRSEAAALILDPEEPIGRLIFAAAGESGRGGR